MDIYAKQISKDSPVAVPIQEDLQTEAGIPLDQVSLDALKITPLLKKYYKKYGEDRFIYMLISFYGNDIRGGIAFANGQSQLETKIKRFDSRSV